MSLFQTFQTAGTVNDPHYSAFLELQAQLLYVIKRHMEEKFVLVFLRFFNKGQKKLGTGLCLRFVVPEHN
jgi:hypothetical protein